MTMTLTQVTTGGVDENINIDSNTLKVDGTNNRVGIGISTPESKVHVFDGNPEVQLQSSGTSTTCQYSMLGRDGSNVAHKVNIQTAASALTFGTGGSSGNSYVPSERMRIDSSGRVGIANTAMGSYNGASNNLVVGNHTGAHGLTIASQNNNSGYIMFADGTSGQQQYEGQIEYNHASNHMRFLTSGNERMRIDSSGNFGIGTSAPGHLLTLKGTQAFEATNSTNDWLAYTYTDNTFRLNYNGAGADEVVITSAGNVGIGTASAVKQLQVGAHGSSSEGTIALASTTSGTCSILMGDGGTGTDVYRGYLQYNHSADAMLFATSADEKMRIDSSGRLLLGTASDQGGGLFQVKGGDASLTKLVSASGGNQVHALRFRVHNANNTTQSASLAAVSAQTVSGWGGVLTFHTKDNNGSPNESVTERARIDEKGRFRVPGYGINVAADGSIGFSEYGYSGGGGTDGVLCRHSGNAYFSVDDHFRIRDNINNNENKRFDFDTNSGSAGADANWNSNNFDFAEMLEWSDGNPNAEDRIGYSVAVDGLTGKIKIAEEGDVPIGIVSGTASFVANAGEIQWAGRSKRDEWGRFVYEPAVTVDDEGNEVPLLDDEGNQRTKPAVNPDWDEARYASYVPRSKRPEWACIGVIGQVYMRKNCPVDARWIKLKEIDSVKDLWLVR